MSLRPRYGHWNDQWGYYFKTYGVPDTVVKDYLGADEIAKIELRLRWIPRIKWCARIGWPCDNEGEWHSHCVEAADGDHYVFAWAV